MRAVSDKPLSGRWRSRAFTIIEMMVATAVFMLMVVLLVSVVSQVNVVWQQMDGQKNRRQSSRALLDLISRDLQGALSPLDGGNYSKIQFDVNPSGADNAINKKSSLFWMTASPGTRSGSDIMTVGYFVRRLSTGSVLCRVQLSGVVSDIWTQAVSLAPADTASDYKGLAADGVLAMYVTLYKKSGDIESAPGQTYKGTALPYSVEVELVIADARTALRLVGNMETADTAPTADAFVTALGKDFRPGIQVYRTRVDIPQAR